MADQKQGKKDGKILGMPRTTGLLVLAAGAVIVGYFLISKFSGSSQQGGQGKGGAAGGGGSWGSGGRTTIRVIRGWQGHRPRPNPGGKMGGG